MQAIRKNRPVKRIASLCALAIALGSGFAGLAARADDEPFQLDAAHWMSFDHYKDAVKRGVISPPVLPAASAPDATAPDAQPAATAEAPAAAPAAASATPVVAAPRRPLDLPPMPGLNKGFQMQVTTTEDERAAVVAAPVIDPDAKAGTPADIHLSDKNWQDPALIARYNRNPHADQEDDVPLDVRMTYLPDGKITPVPTPEHVTAQHKARIALEKSMAKKSKPQQDPAACAAIDAYKKQQLDAIQSDRQTLKALQDAIASLGLQKQLGFMAGNNSSLTASGPQTSPASIDIPASTSVR